MSESPGDNRGEANASSSSSSNGLVQPSTSKSGGEDKATNPIEKTISCVSCRKRKLKCDRIKPACGTCSRLRHDCEYPERRRNLGSKRRNMRELEARLAQVETQLVSETAKNAPTSDNITPAVNETPDWNNYPLDMNMDFEDDTLLDFPMPNSTYSFQQQVLNLMPEPDFFSQDLLSQGLQEPLPPDEMIEELHQIYFEKFHYSMPMVHKQRYLAGLHLPAHMRPPICLRYAMWAIAATISDTYSQYDDMLYERSRRYAELAEMKGNGETFVTIPHAQAWALIGTYEAKKTYFTRAWMSTGRVVRLCHMLGLHRLDGASVSVKMILPPPKDAIELEERRRTFWAAFYADRWASSGTGWPMTIDEKMIQTNLPASEEAFESGDIRPGISLQDALTANGASLITPFGGVVLSACLFGHNFEHLHQGGPKEHPEDLVNGEFWKRHRKMDNVLSNTFMFLPDHLRLPGGLRDMNIVFLHMNIHASTICLHQAAVVTAEKNGVHAKFIRQCRTRSVMAAEEIANIMRLISHLDTSTMNSWMGFCLYVACGVFIQDLRTEKINPQSLTNLDFLIDAMKAIGKRHSITNHFTAQVELDVKNSGIKRPGETASIASNKLAAWHEPMAGVMPPRNGPLEVSKVCAYILGQGREMPPDDSYLNLASATNGVYETGLFETSTDQSSGQSFNQTNTGLSQTEFSYYAPITTPTFGVLPVRSLDANSNESPNATVISNFASTMPNTWSSKDTPTSQSPEESATSRHQSGSTASTSDSEQCNARARSHAGIMRNYDIDFSSMSGESRQDKDTTSTSSEQQKSIYSSHGLLDGDTEFDSTYIATGDGSFITGKPPANVFLFPETRNTQVFNSATDQIDLNKTWPLDLDEHFINSEEIGWTFDANSPNPMPNMPGHRPKGPTPQR